MFGRGDPVQYTECLRVWDRSESDAGDRQGAQRGLTPMERSVRAGQVMSSQPIPAEFGSDLGHSPQVYQRLINFVILNGC